MLTIIVPLGGEGFDHKTQEFVTLDGFELKLEHSLVSLSKWESKFEKPFLTEEDKTAQEALSYVEMMILSSDVSQKVFDALSESNLDEINQYINAKMTATWFNDKANKMGKPSSEVITSELVYYWMIQLGIPFECQYWHFNRLLTLIKICNVKNAPAGKISKRDLAEQRRMLNAQRKAQFNTAG